MNINKPLFSVLIANYNNSQYLKEAIDSVMEQSYPHWEIIFVDDCSTDNSLALMEEWYGQESRIKVFKNSQNQGCGFTKSRCAELAKGEICGFLDPDDKLMPTALETMVTAHAAHPEHALVYSTHYICNIYMERMMLATKVKAVPANSSYLACDDVNISHFATFKTAFYRQTEGINSQLKRAVDQDLYYKLEEVGKVEFLEVPLYEYRIHKKGISTTENTSKAKYWHLQVQKQAMDRRKKSRSSLQDFSSGKLINHYQGYLKFKLEKAVEKKEYGKFLYLQLSALQFFNFSPRAFRYLKYMGLLFLPSKNSLKTNGK